MNWPVAKFLASALIVAVVSELARRGGKLGALFAALPLVTILALIWMHIEQQPAEKIASQAWYTFWYVLPTLPMLLAFPFLLPRLGFWPSLLAGIAITLACFAAWAFGLRRFWIDLL